MVLCRVPSKCFTSRLVASGGCPFGPPRAVGQLTVKLALEPATVEVRMNDPAEIENGGRLHRAELPLQLPQICQFRIQSCQLSFGFGGVQLNARNVGTKCKCAGIVLIEPVIHHGENKHEDDVTGEDPGYPSVPLG